MLKNLIEKNRSYRKFYADHKINKEELQELINLARLSASARNQQALKFSISNEEDTNQIIFEQLAWAGFLKDWKGPEKNERPSAYIIIVADKNISNSFLKDWIYADMGIACQSILLGATEKELGGCIIAAVQRKQLHEKLNIAQNHEILCVVALGKPKEQIVIDEINTENSDTKYWRDKNNVHHVPKRNLEEIIL